MNEGTVNKKKISIIIPTHNRWDNLKECIDSILVQTYPEFEIIIIDDCSTQDIELNLKNTFVDSRIFYYRNDINKGPGGSRQKGYLKATGDYIIFCDDDDYYIDSKYFENVIDILKDIDISMVCSNTNIKYESENKEILTKLDFPNLILNYEYLQNFQTKYKKPNSTFSTIFRKEHLEKSCFSDMEMMNDVAIYLRALLNNGKVYKNDNVVGNYRMNSKNITFNIKPEFLIENLNEKKYVYKEICKRNLFNNTEKWFKEQIYASVEYFITSSNPVKSDLIKITNWIVDNVYNNKLFVLKIKVLYKKNKIVKKIRGNK